MSNSADEATLGAGRFLILARRGTYEYVRRARSSGVVAVVAITDNNEIVLVEEPRPAVRSIVISIPAGLAGDEPGAENEAFQQAAERELEEETGWQAGRWTHLVDSPTSPGLTDETISFFLATDLQRVGDGGGVDDEDIQVHVVPLDSVDTWLDAQRNRGALVDNKLYAGLHFAHQALK